jgi:hypothetical protein
MNAVKHNPADVLAITLAERHHFTPEFSRMAASYVDKARDNMTRFARLQPLLSGTSEQRATKARDLLAQAGYEGAVVR